MRRLPVFFLLDADANICESIKINYRKVFSSIVKKIRDGVSEFESHQLNIDLNIITINDECKIIISEHSLDDVLNLKLIFEGQSNYLTGIDFLKKIITKNINDFYYTPITITFITKSIDENMLNLYKGLNWGLGVGHSHPDYCEIFIDQYIDYNYVVLFNEHKNNKFTNSFCTILNHTDVDDYNFRGEIKEFEIN